MMQFALAQSIFGGLMGGVPEANDLIISGADKPRFNAKKDWTAAIPCRTVRNPPATAMPMTHTQ